MMPFDTHGEPGPIRHANVNGKSVLERSDLLPPAHQILHIMGYSTGPTLVGRRRFGRWLGSVSPGTGSRAQLGNFLALGVTAPRSGLGEPDRVHRPHHDLSWSMGSVP